MSVSLNSYFEAYEKPCTHTFEKQENPQVYSESNSKYQHITPKRHMLGLVGGNDVYEIKGNRVDLESDLYGITRPNTWGTLRHHLPSKNADNIQRINPKNNIDVVATPIPREEYQMWSYSATFAPLSFKKNNCMPKNKY
jgi:hypothetical protein